jgi:uncharacterized protein
MGQIQTAARAIHRVGQVTDLISRFTRVILSFVAPRRKSTAITLETLRAFSVRRSLWQVPTLARGLSRFGFVQADPIRAPARAQDLILWQRVKNYAAGDLEKKYQKLEIEEDFFVNYGFLTREVQAFMHPRQYGDLRIEKAMPGLTDRVLDFVKGNGATHPKMLETHFGKLSVANNWGGTSQSTTRALDALHYRGLVRVARRDNGIKVYEAASHLEPMFSQPLEPEVQARGLLDLILSVYAPLPLQSLNQLVSLSGYGGPHLTPQVRAAVKHVVTHELETVTLDGLKYVWPANERLNVEVEDRVRFLAPFDPVVWDRRRFEHLHGWAYRFEAYTPPAKRKLGYYALPLLWRDQVIGWANAKVMPSKSGSGALDLELGFVDARPKSKGFSRALEAEISSLKTFLGLA